MGLDLQTPVTRYLEEMSHAIGDPVRLDANFALMIERLYGDVEGERVEEMLSLRRKGRTRRQR